MNKLEFQEIIAARLEILAILGNPIPIQIKELKIEAGDYIISCDSYIAGMTRREVSATEYLAENEYSPDYLGDYWICEWSGHPNLAKHKYIEEKKFDESEKKKHADFLKNQALLYGPPEGYSKKTLEGFISHNEKMTEILTKIYNWPYAHASEISPIPSGRLYLNLLLVGATGTGKTHLASALFNCMLQEDDYEGIQFISCRALIRKFKEKERKESSLMIHYGDGKSYHDDSMDSGCATLIIDDLVADLDKYSIGVINEILDRRVSAEIYTIITTNLYNAELVKMLGERGASLLFDRCLVAALGGQDYRQVRHRTSPAK